MKVDVKTRAQRTGLLVSVRDPDEAEAALAGGADVLDIKEPRHGALGRAAGETIRDIAATVAGRRPLSAALGELRDFQTYYAELPPGIGFAKLGLSGMSDDDDWPRRWRRALEALPAHVAPVAVAYADWRDARSPAPREVLAAAGDAGCRVVLIDTYNKNGRGLVSHWAPKLIRQFVASCRAANLPIVLAGSLTPPVINDLLPIGPDLFAVRGAACDGDRQGRVSTVKVRQLRLLCSLPA